jgi:multisubunit Na+/H+ antiporter MnhF subunit
MNEWEIAATVFGFLLIPCVGVCLFASVEDALVAVEVAGVLVVVILMALSEGFRRQPFIDLAVVLAPMALIGSLTFARLMERHL